MADDCGVFAGWDFAQEVYGAFGVGRRREFFPLLRCFRRFSVRSLNALWNFKHLLKPMRIRGFNGVNTARGYGAVLILTPEDIVKGLEA
ncbi:MAG: hypothetical protein NTX50_29190 [Candidatus Sumerlaeota bacterium]|nr:hypothetical protein [Candidatus Sumerlaeota bacterium]